MPSIAARGERDPLTLRPRGLTAPARPRGERAARAPAHGAPHRWSLAPLDAPEPASAVDQIEVHAAGRRWHYVRRGNTWYFPAYHRAFVLNRRVEHLLQSLLATPATFISTEPGDLARYGLGPGSVRIHLLDQQGRPLLEVRQGRGAPGARAGESYVQRVGADSIFHLHAHPVHALDTAPPAPMLDRRVLPQALQRKGLRQITFSGDPSYPAAIPQPPAKSHDGTRPYDADLRVDRLVCNRCGDLSSPPMQKPTPTSSSA